MLPPDQSFDAHDRTCGELDRRLVMQNELLCHAGATQVRDQLHPPGDVLVHSRRVDDVLTPSARLRLVHGDVRRPEELLGIRAHGDANARADEHLALVEPEWLLELREHTFRDIDGRRETAPLLHEDRELVTADSGDSLARRQRPAQSLAHRAEQAVATEMAEAVVDGFEVVQVEEENGQIRVFPGADDEGVLNTVGEERPICEAGQGVVESLVPELLLNLLSARNVLKVPLNDECAVALSVADDAPLVMHPDDATVARKQAVFDPEWVSCRLGQRMGFENALTIVGMQGLDEERGVRGPLLRRIPEHGLDLRARVDVRACLVQTVDVDGERQLFDQGPVPLFRGLTSRFCLTTLSDVPNAGGEHRWAGHVDPADGQLGREERLVGAHRLDLDSATEQLSGAGSRPFCRPPRERTPMSLTRLRRDDERRELLAENGVLRIAERHFGGFVELQHPAEMVDRYHRVERGIEDRVGVRLV